MQTLERENHAEIAAPSWPQIEEALSAIHPRDCSFVILSRADSYIQTAGARLRLIIEVRRKKSIGFEHFVLGRGRRPDERLTSVNYSAGAIALYPSEIFALDDAKEAFRAFFEAGEIPTRFIPRDVTQEQKG